MNIARIFRGLWLMHHRRRAVYGTTCIRIGDM